jgi:hypothetical protein
MLSEEQKQAKLSQPKGYAFEYYFFYKENDIFPEYEVNLKINNYRIRFYLIDFRHIYPLKCDKINRNQIHEKILRSKCLELTVFTREELRNKLAHYFGRPTQDDEAILCS